MEQSSETKPGKIDPVEAIGLPLLQLQVPAQPQQRFSCWSCETELVLWGSALNLPYSPFPPRAEEQRQRAAQERCENPAAGKVLFALVLTGISCLEQGELWGDPCDQTKVISEGETALRSSAALREELRLLLPCWGALGTWSRGCAPLLGSQDG